MNFASPEDADLIEVDEISPTEDTTVTLAFTPNEAPSEQPLTRAMESAASEIVEVHKRLDTAESERQHRESVIESQQDTIAELETQLAAVTETLEETQEQVEAQDTTLQTIEETLNQLQQLEESMDSVQAELERLDDTATEAAEWSERQNDNLCVIHAALFDEEFSCPSCEEGTISRESTVGKTEVVCDACDLSKPISVL